METSRRSLSVFLFFAMIMVSLGDHQEDVSDAALPQNSNAKSPITSAKQHPLASELEEKRNKAYKDVGASNRNKRNGGGGGGGGGGKGGGGGGGGGGGRGGWGWGNGGGGGSSSGEGMGGGGSSSGEGMGGGGGWRWGGGGGGWWGWGCGRPKENHNGRGRGHHAHKKRSFGNEDFRIGEFAECMGRGRCQGMRLDCPLHCGGPCFYDCKNMCKAHCRR